MLQRLPVGIQSFAKLRQLNCLYVDKTELLYELVRGGKLGDYFFLSRPRRFGKSLLVTTLKEIFLGNKNLFKGLWISEKSDYVWQPYPVIHLDFSLIGHDTVQDLKVSLGNHLQNIAREAGFELPVLPTLQDSFGYLVKKLAQQGRVVILVDEYDKPILDHLRNPEEAEVQQEVLHQFYAVFKGLDEYIRFIFITGVTKFSKTTLFSGLNNLHELTMSSWAAPITGYTHEELQLYFKPYVQANAQKIGCSEQVVFEKLRFWYNGYRFSQLPLTVYNPFSILRSLTDCEYKNYWFESGTPSFVMHLIERQYPKIAYVQEYELSNDSLGAFDPQSVDLIVILFQTGYLTIVDYNPATQKYKLDYPNEETRQSFTQYVTAAVTGSDIVTVEGSVSQLAAALKRNNVSEFCRALQRLFAHVPYYLHIEQERYYHSLFQMIGTLLGLNLQSEVVTDKGRVDLVLETKERFFIFELKYGQSGAKALQQIEDRRYFERYQNKGKQIVLVWLGCRRTEKRVLIDCASKELAE